MLMSTLADALSKIVLKFNGVIFNIYHVRCSILLFTFLDEHLEEECVKCFIFFFCGIRVVHRNVSITDHHIKMVTLERSERAGGLETPRAT